MTEPAPFLLYLCYDCFVRARPDDEIGLAVSMPDPIACEVCDTDTEIAFVVSDDTPRMFYRLGVASKQRGLLLEEVQEWFLAGYTSTKAPGRRT